MRTYKHKHAPEGSCLQGFRLFASDEAKWEDFIFQYLHPNLPDNVSLVHVKVKVNFDVIQQPGQADLEPKICKPPERLYTVTEDFLQAHEDLRQVVLEALCNGNLPHDHPVKQILEAAIHKAYTEEEKSDAKI